MAGSGGDDLISDYLDRPDAIHRRAASLAIVRSGGGSGGAAADGDGPRIVDGAGRDGRRARSSRRLSLSSWLGAPRARPAPAPAGETDSVDSRSRSESTTAEQPAEGSGRVEGTSAWSSWKPMRALSRLGKRRAGCLFSVEVIAVRGVPASMDGLRLAVSVRKAEAKDGRMQTMPVWVRGARAEFDETLFVKCSIYFTGGPGTGKPLRLEPRRFVVSVVAVETPDVRLGTHAVDVSSLVLDSLERRSSEGRRVRRFDRAFSLSGKAAGGELLLRLGFQLMEDAGLSLYTQAAASSRDVSVSPARARVHNKNSFSVATTPSKITASDGAISPSMRAYRQLLHRLNVDKRGDGEDDDELSTTSAGGDVDYAIPEYEVVDKGVETVKEVVDSQANRDVLRDLNSIAEQIEAIEALMTNGGKKSPKGVGHEQLRLDADEEMVAVEFLRKLEVADSDDKNRKLKQPMTPRSEPEKKAAAAPPPVVPDLGQSLGPAVQTRDGGFLVSMNPFDMPITSRDAQPRLAMQVSRPFVLPSAMAETGFDVLQKMAAAAGGPGEVRDKVASLGGMENLTGKTPEQVGFEGIAEAVIGGRRTEGASSSAARSVRLVRKLAAAVSEGRRERVATGIWSAGNDPETLEEVLAFSLQKLEAMAVDALMIQAEMTDEDAPFEVAPAPGNTDVFDSLVSSDEWSESRSTDGRVTLVAAIQLRDPSRRYEAVGAPMLAVVQSARMLGGAAGHGGGRFKVRSLHVGGVQTRRSSGVGGSASWRAERQKLSAMQWALAHGPAARTGNRALTPASSQARARQLQRPDVVWSLSSRVLAGMWLKTVRNPDVKIGGAAAAGGSNT